VYGAVKDCKIIVDRGGISKRFESTIKHVAAALLAFLHATAVPAGTAESTTVLGMGILSVRLSVRHDPVPIQGQVR